MSTPDDPEQLRKVLTKVKAVRAKVQEQDQLLVELEASTVAQLRTLLGPCKTVVVRGIGRRPDLRCAQWKDHEGPCYVAGT